MAESDKVAERYRLILQLGKLLAPIEKIVEKVTPPTLDEYQVATANFQRDWNRWIISVNQFVMVGDRKFNYEYNEITQPTREMLNLLPKLARDTSEQEEKQSQISRILKKCQTQTIAAIDLVPITWFPRLLKEQTPLMTYFHIFEAISTAKSRIHYFDRYLTQDFYLLYLRNINRLIEIRLVTTEGNKKFGVKNVLPVSELAAQEFANYQLIKCAPSDMHDRNLRIDDTNFFLGPSIKEAGKNPTNFSPCDSTTTGHQILDNIISKGTVVT